MFVDSPVNMGYSTVQLSENIQNEVMVKTICSLSAWLIDKLFKVSR